VLPRTGASGCFFRSVMSCVVLFGVAVYCSMLQCVAVCCSVLQCVAMSCVVLFGVMLLCNTVWCDVAEVYSSCTLHVLFMYSSCV